MPVLHRSFSHFLPLALAIISLCSLEVKAEQEQSWYDVELIVFARLDNAVRTEVWPERVPPDYDPTSIEPTAAALPDDPETTVPESAGDDTPIPFQLIPYSELRLTDEVQRIAASRDLRVVLHTAWRQPGLAREEAVPIRMSGRINASEAAVNEAEETPIVIVKPSDEREVILDIDPTDRIPLYCLGGTFKLILARNLIIESRLAMLIETPFTGTATTGTGDAEYDEMPSLNWQTYRLEEARHIRSKELHYFDHPAMGMVVEITPYEIKSDEDTATSAP